MKATDWKIGPPVLVGEKILWSGNAQNRPQKGAVRWIGKIPELCEDWCLGIELEEALIGDGCDGVWMNRRLYDCKEKHGLLVPINEIQKFTARRNSRPTSVEIRSNLELDVSQVRDSTNTDLGNKSDKKNQETRPRDRYSSLEWKLSEWSLRNRSSRAKSNRTSITEEVLDRFNVREQILKSKSQDVKSSLRKRRKRKISQEAKLRRNSRFDDDSIGATGTLDDLTKFTVNEAYEKLTTLDSKARLKNMNDVAGYFKEIKEGDERFYKGDSDGPDLGGQPHSKQKKFFSFLKWFKKNKDEPNLKLPGESSAASSPMFVRKRTSSCESVDTLFSTQTVRSFAYIPPTQYQPSAPPSSLLEFEKSSENLSENASPENNASEECIYDRKKKRKAPQPPRLTRENSLPTTLEHKKPDAEDEDGIKTYHRRTVSESFKDKKAGAYCHVQGKRKAPLPPPASALYPNLQKVNNPYPSLYKKKKPAPPPPESNPEPPTPRSPADGGKEAEAAKSTGEAHPEVREEPKTGEPMPESEEKRIKNNQTAKERLTKDVSLSPLPSRPWYKRSHRDSAGSNIIRKDLLKGFDKKKNKETDDWMPEVGFSRRSLSAESNHNKFNIFSRLEKNEDKKKEEKRKSQISILTNISELDREAAEIVRKEQAEEKKMLEKNDARYYSNVQDVDRHNVAESSKRENFLDGKGVGDKNKLSNLLLEEKNGEQNKIRLNAEEVRLIENDRKEKEEPTKVKEEKEKAKDKENQLNSEAQANDKPKPNSFSPNVLADLTNSGPASAEKNLKPNPTSFRLNHFNVENKQLNYLNEPWVCQKCTLENPGWRVFCEICSSVKPKFLFNPAVQEDGPKPEPKLQETKAKEVKPPPETPPVHLEDKSEIEKTETLEELRKKRMTFFTSKLESTEKEIPDEKKSNEVKPENKELKLQITEEPTVPPSEVVKDKEVQNPVVSNTVPDNLVVSKTKQSDGEPKCGGVKKKQPKKEEVAEAYVITKTIVLEDIIIRKGDKASKTSTSAQTKSCRSSAPDPAADAVRPPPRTKKIAFETTPDFQKPSTSKEGANFTQDDLEELTKSLTHAKGLADFRANIETMPLNTEMNTVAVNRLLRKLETAINCGDHFVAAGLAKELALMKINCSVTRQVGSVPSPSTSDITIDLYVEDKISHQGPIPMQVSPAMTLLQLKKKAERELGISTDVQRWILGKKLATDDTRTLEAEGVKSDFCPVFLYLVAPDNRSDKGVHEKTENNDDDVKSSPKRDSPGRKGKGWYYNYEEDHYSYCEDTDDESRDSSPVKNPDPPPKVEKESMAPQSDPKKVKEEEEVSSKSTKPSVFDLKTRESENELDKELKLISANSVKQEVERLNKTFAENSRQARMGFKSSPSPETWKCGACAVVNQPGRLSCSGCNAKKVVARLNSPRVSGEKGNFKKEPLKMESGRANEGSNENVHYKALIQLQDVDLVPNAEPFNCSICMVDYSPGEGVTLKDCLHTFCKTCLVSTVRFSEDAEVKCPYLDKTYSCTSVLQQREIKALVPKGIFEMHLAKSVKEAENKIGNAFHCKTPDCKGWCIYEDNVNEFHCPVCKFSNCLTCQVIHTGINCREYQERMKDASVTDVDAKKTRDMLEEMVVKGEAMACPKCQVVLMKKWGCDWLRCSMCKTEICWVTRGFRWGPAGKGDTSGGCKCGVNGVKCHPKCNYCH